MEKKRQKTLEKEAEELSRRGRGEKERPAWRDEESDPEEKSPAPEPWRNVVGGSGFNRHSKSVSISPDKVKVHIACYSVTSFYCVVAGLR